MSDIFQDSRNRRPQKRKLFVTKIILGSLAAAALHSLISSTSNSLLHFFRFFFSRALTDNIPRSVFHFHINLANIFPQHTKTDQLHTADKAYDACHARPACYRMSCQCYDHRPYHPDKTEHCNTASQSCDQVQWLDTETCDSIKCQCQHFA